MEFNIQDQLIKGFQFGEMSCTILYDMLISDATISTRIFGVYYENGVLTINQPLLMGSSSTPTEAYIDDNKILKLR